MRPTGRHTATACWPAWRRSAAGEVYQACVCTQFTGTVTGTPLDFFIDGVARTSPARAAYVAGSWGRWHRCPRSFSCGAAVPS